MLHYLADFSIVYDINQVWEVNPAAGKTWVYTYDNGGNITSRMTHGYTVAKNPGTSSGPNAAPDVAYYTYGDTHLGDLLTAYKGQTITHDGIGNSAITYAMDFFYDASGMPFAMKYNGDLCYYIINL